MLYSLQQREPRPAVAAARPLLRHLAGHKGTFPSSAVPAPLLGRWLVERGLAPLAYAHFQDTWPALAQALQAEAFATAAQSSLHFSRLQRIAAAFAEAELPVVLLKGAALAQCAYADPAQRSMADVDLWLPQAHMAEAISIMKALGFHHYGNGSRPLRLQLLAGGEVTFGDDHGGAVELHLAPFPGWWVQRTAAVDTGAIWERLQPIPGGPAQVATMRQMAVEDMVIHVTVHLAVNHQFALFALRALLDIALVAQACPVAWGTVARRARQWRLATAVWTALSLLDQLVGVEGLQAALAPLRPSRPRRGLLTRLVTPGSLLTGVDIRHSRQRFLLLLLLVDRPRDMIRLIFRTLWPEAAWLAARYQDNTGRRQHLWHVLRHGQV
jgi:hypothetical protein